MNEIGTSKKSSLKSRKEAKELRRIEPCPCESGHTYGRCCRRKKLRWVRDSRGEILKRIPVHPELTQVIGEQRERFVRIYGREPTKGDTFLPKIFTESEIESQTVDFLLKAKVPPEYIYAYQKTGLIVTSFNVELIPDSEIQEWNEAIEEFKKAKATRLVSNEHDSYLRNLASLLEETDACTEFLQLIVRSQGTALNIKCSEAGGKYVVRDFVYFCITKVLKTFESIRCLLENSLGEDSLTLVRSAYESYLTIAFVIAHPSEINSFVAAEIRKKAGEIEFRRGKDGRRFRFDPVTQQEFSVYGPAAMAKRSPFPEDKQIYHWFYEYLSEFSHPNIMSIEAYLDGHNFTAFGKSKCLQAHFYAIFVISLVLDIAAKAPDLKRRLKADLIRFLKRIRPKLEEVFSNMADSKDASLPQVFAKRAARIGQY